VEASPEVFVTVILLPESFETQSLAPSVPHIIYKASPPVTQQLSFIKKIIAYAAIAVNTLSANF